MKRIVIIGGGIIGLACAYYLRKKDMEVTVIDKGKIGEGCSFANMGWITPTLSQPVPAPGLIGTSLKWMLKKDSPLYIKLSKMPTLSSWILSFWRYCNQAAFNKGFDAGLEISKNTFKLFDELEAEESLDFEIHHKGLLIVFLDKESLEKKYKEICIVDKVGVPKPIIKTRKEVLEMEPNLSDNVIGGIFLPGERHVKPDSFSSGLHNWLERNGVEFKENTEIIDVFCKNNKIVAVQSTKGENIKADQFLFATGAWSGFLAKKLKFNLPITAGKGYSITIPSPNIKLKHPLYLGTSKTGLSPYHDSLRIAGTMELSGLNTDIDKKRVQSLKNTVNQYFKTEINGGPEVIWSGMRPMTPDGLPVLGVIPGIDNAFVATAHVMSGISMSLSTGYIMANLICSNKEVIDRTPVSPLRFHQKK